MSRLIPAECEAGRSAQQGDRTHPPLILEHRYRLLLLAYPPEYRADRGDEILATFLDGARPTQTMPALADAADVLKHAAQRRISLLSQAEFSSGLRLAAPWALAIAAGISAFVWWRVEPQVSTTGPMAYGAWLGALAARIFLQTRAFTGLAVAATLLTVPLAAFGAAQRPPLWIIMSLTCLGAIAFAGHSRYPPTESKLNTIAAAAAVAVGCHLLSPSPDGYYQPIIARVGVVVAAGVLVTVVVAFHRRRQGQSARLPIIAGLLLALPATWLGPIDTIAWHLPLDNLTAARFGRLAHVILATCVVLCAIAWLGRGKAPFSARRLAAVTAGSAAGYAGFAATNQSTPHAIVTVAVLVLLTILLRALPSVPVMISSSVATLAASWLIGVYSNNWSASAWVDPGRTVVLASMLTMVPCSVVAFAAFRPSARVAAGIVAVVWICYLNLPALIAWGPLLWALAAIITVAAGRELLRWRRRMAVDISKINAIFEAIGQDDSAALATDLGRRRLRIDQDDW